VVRNKKSKKRRGAIYERRVLLSVLLVAGGLAVFFIAAGSIYVTALMKGLPSPEQFGERKISQSTKLYDRTGEVPERSDSRGRGRQFLQPAGLQPQRYR